jgi:4-diphosphocytidyl-2-C-methyl-D-erythritol kinase
MSGSGATCFGLFEQQAQAERAAADLRNAEPGWWVASAPLLADTSVLDARL